MPRRTGQLLVVVGVVLLALNLRPAASTVGPLLEDIRADLDLSGTAAGALLTLPVLCFGLMAPLAPALGRRLGYPRTVTLALGTLTIALALRLLPGTVPLFAGAALAGAAIAVGNVSLPVLVRQNFPDRAGLLTGLYMIGLVGGAAVSAGIAVPLAEALGDSWQNGLAIWALPALAALLFWLPQTRASGSAVTGAQHAEVRPLLRDRLAWEVTLFFGIQSCGFYIVLSWLPSLFESHGIGAAEAGALLGVLLLAQLPFALTVPSLASRRPDQRLYAVGCTAATALGVIGLMAAPVDGRWVWAVLLGIGQGASFPLAQILIQLRSPSVTATAGLSTMAQCAGYLIAATGPLAVGVLYDASESWTTPLALMLVLLAAQLVVGLGAARDRHVAARPVSSDP